MSSGSRLLRNAKVKEEIDRLKQEKLNQVYLTQADIFQKYLDIAFADMGDYVTFGKKKVPVWKRVDGQDIPVMDPNTGQQKIAEYSYVDLKESTGVDTSIISEVSEGKNGIKIKRADQMKALQWLTEHMDMATQEQKARLELLKLQKEKLSEGTAENDEAVEKMDNISKIFRTDAAGESRRFGGLKNTKNVRQSRNFSVFCCFVVILHKGIKCIKNRRSQ